MPSWLFWSLVEASEKDRTRTQFGFYRALGTGAGGFEKQQREEIITSWNENMRSPIRGTAKVEAARSQLEMDWQERAKLWGG